jgi:hypothetical protein
MDTPDSQPSSRLRPANVRFASAAATHRGGCRVNADASFLDETGAFFAVSDGMGDVPTSAANANAALATIAEVTPARWAQLPHAERSPSEARDLLLMGLTPASERVRGARQNGPIPVSDARLRGVADRSADRRGRDEGGRRGRGDDAPPRRGPAGGAASAERGRRLRGRARYRRGHDQGLQQAARRRALPAPPRRSAGAPRPMAAAPPRPGTRRRAVKATASVRSSLWASG